MAQLAEVQAVFIRSRKGRAQVRGNAAREQGIGVERLRDGALSGLREDPGVERQRVLAALGREPLAESAPGRDRDRDHVDAALLERTVDVRQVGLDTSEG